MFKLQGYSFPPTVLYALRLRNLVKQQLNLDEGAPTEPKNNLQRPAPNFQVLLQPKNYDMVNVDFVVPTEKEKQLLKNILFSQNQKSA